MDSRSWVIVTHCTCLCFISHWKPSKLTAPLIGPQVLVQWAAPTVSVVSVRGLSPNYRARGPSFELRALWMSRVVNHCQQHISVFLGAESSQGFFFLPPDPLGNYFQMLRDIKNSAALLVLIYSCWLITQSVFTTKFCSNVWQTRGCVPCSGWSHGATFLSFFFLFFF